jgi:hypothetical protein
VFLNRFSVRRGSRNRDSRDIGLRPNLRARIILEQGAQ